MRYLHAGTILVIGCTMLAFQVYAVINHHPDGVMAAMVIGCALILAADFAFFVVRLRGGK